MFECGMFECVANIISRPSKALSKPVGQFRIRLFLSLFGPTYGRFKVVFTDRPSPSSPITRGSKLCSETDQARAVLSHRSQPSGLHPRRGIIRITAPLRTRINLFNGRHDCTPGPNPHASSPTPFLVTFLSYGHWHLAPCCGITVRYMIEELGSGDPMRLRLNRSMLLLLQAAVLTGAEDAGGSPGNSSKIAPSTTLLGAGLCFEIPGMTIVPGKAVEQTMLARHDSRKSKWGNMLSPCKYNAL